MTLEDIKKLKIELRSAICDAIMIPHYEDFDILAEGAFDEIKSKARTAFDGFKASQKNLDDCQIIVSASAAADLINGSLPVSIVDVKQGQEVVGFDVPITTDQPSMLHIVFDFAETDALKELKKESAELYGQLSDMLVMPDGKEKDAARSKYRKNYIVFKKSEADFMKPQSDESIIEQVK